MRRNDSWLGAASEPSRSRGSHYRGSERSVAGLSRVIVGVVIVVVVVSVIQLIRPVPLPKARQTISSALIPGTPPSLPWPSQGGGEVGIQNVGIIGGFNPNQQIPLASVAKIVTALVIVKDHPLSSGNDGPTLTLTPADASEYQTMLQQQDSVMAVVSGEKLNEYQLLEALLIPSADNIAVTLATWDAGSVPAFVAKMNAMAKSLGMVHTVFKDPSGLDTGTVGSAGDQVLAAQALLKNQVLSQIVAKPQATLPVVGVVYNVNYNVGHDGFVGIKTGSMGNGGNLVFAATGTGSKDLIVGGNPRTIGRPAADLCFEREYKVGECSAQSALSVQRTQARSAGRCNSCTWRSASSCLRNKKCFLCRMARASCQLQCQVYEAEQQHRQGIEDRGSDGHRGRTVSGRFSCCWYSSSETILDLATEAAVGGL